MHNDSFYQPDDTNGNEPPAIIRSDLIKAPNPPLAAQVLYALAFLSLIFGLLAALLVVVGPPDLAGNITSALGYHGSNPKITGVVFGLIVVGLFILANAVRARRRWGLVWYTVVVLIAFSGSMFEWFTRSALDKLLNGSNPSGTFLPYIFVLPLLIILWIKNRQDFS